MEKLGFREEKSTELEPPIREAQDPKKPIPNQITKKGDSRARIREQEKEISDEE